MESVIDTIRLDTALVLFARGAMHKVSVRLSCILTYRCSEGGHRQKVMSQRVAQLEASKASCMYGP